jgi:sarcosine dehydrogenase
MQESSVQHTDNGELGAEASVLIVGGGIAGCSLAYQLAALGVDGVVVLEQNRVAAGTTWHAAGAVGRMRTSPSLARLNDRSAALYARMEAESGLPTGWREAGGLTLARSRERLAQLRRAGALAGRFGVEVHELGPAEAQDLWPLAQMGDVVGAVWLPHDGVVEPASLARAIAEAASRRRVRIAEGSRVTELLREGRRVTGVRTDAGPIAADVVVLCTGMWTHQLARAAGLAIPLQPVEHHYVLSHPTGEEIGHLPVTRDPDGSIYFRGKGDAIMLGAFQRVSKPWTEDPVPADFAFSLLDPDWEHFAAPLREGLQRIPTLEAIGIERFVNGPESFTPDGNPLVGRIPGADGLYIAAGFNSSGLAYAGGVGEALAQWIVDGEPASDLWAIDLRRFSARQAEPGFLRERAVEVLWTHMRMPYPNVEFERGRGLRRSPLHDRLAERGACFGEKHGMERPNWFAPPGQPAAVRYGFGRQNWFAASRAEHLATRSTGALFDQSGFGKFRVSGRDALALLQRACANDLDVDVGRVVYSAMLSRRGTFASDLTVQRTGAEFLVVTGTAQAVADGEWIRALIGPGEQVELEDVTERYAVLGVMGPAVRELVQPLADADLSEAALPFGSSRELRIAGVACRAARLTYVGEPGWELYVDVADAGALYDGLRERADGLGIVDGGHYAINSLRLEKGYRAWGADISMSDTPLEAGLAFAVAWDKPGGFNGRDALVRQRLEPPRRRMVSLVLEDPEPVLWGGELLLRGEDCVGYTTSGAYGHSVGASVALAWHDTGGDPLTAELLAAGGYEVDIAGARFTARVSLAAPLKAGGVVVGS